ncbi:sigma 54-interacting transcriptional regulator [Wukongibacter baidiensis]|uniref:sigma-54 interaction domain-containing protein n=1 Tax=Wukongibacter baidiensis TaxID=1723361 RepID=UPI003D7F63FF
MPQESIKQLLANYDLENNTGIINLLEDLNEGVMIVDRDFNIIYYSENMEEIESLDASSVVGKNFFDVFPDKSIQNSTIYQCIKEGKKVVDKIEKYFTYKGNPVSVINTTIPLLKDGEIIAALDINRDLNNLGKLISGNGGKSIDKMDKKVKNIASIGLNDRIKRYSFNQILTQDKKMLSVIEHGKRAAKQDSPVLLVGETGTGKELFAQSIHYDGIRSSEPFIALNCAALPSDLMEGILFGTTKGSFTGAIDRSGLFEQADRGTLLLDEINSMDIRLQAKLLRVLQEGTFRRIGGKKEIKTDVRIIATTNHDLLELINENKFRLDLFYRLSVITIQIPSLKERKMDIDFLTLHFVDAISQKFDKRNVEIDYRVVELFRQYKWPGNIRELKNVIEGALCLMDNESGIGLDNLPKYILQSVEKTAEEYILSNLNEQNKYSGTSKTLHDQLAEYEKKIIADAIVAANNNITKAAEALGLSRQSLQYRMKRLKIDKHNFMTYYKK